MLGGIKKNFPSPDQAGDRTIQIAVGQGAIMICPSQLTPGWKATREVLSRISARGLPMAGVLSILLALSGLAAQSATPYADPGPRQVRGFGDPEHLEFHGNSTFSATDFRQGLVFRARFLTASQPGAPLEDFLTAVREELLSGYQRSGFPEARVEVQPDPATERVQVNIQEGPRFRCRSVRVVGVRGVTAAQLISCLTNPPDASADATDTPRWTPGAPACFDPGSLPTLKKEAEERLATLGWFFPELALRVEAVPGAGLADLILDVRGLGPQGRVQEFTVSGNQHNSTRDILRFLGLKRGSRVTPDSLSTAETKLRNSGRFLEAELKAEPLRARMQANGIRLAIRVREYEPAPRLLAKLKPKQQALLRVGDWLSDLGSLSKDAVVTFAVPSPIACSGHLVLSPRAGALLSFDNTGVGPLAGYTLLISRTLMGLLALQDGRKLAFQSPDLAPRLWCGVTPNAAGADDPFNLTFGMGWFGGDQGQESNEADAPVLAFDLLPAAFLDLGDRLQAVSNFRNATITLTNRCSSLKTQARTGEILAYDLDYSGCSVSVRFREGAFSQERRVWETQALACCNSNQPHHVIAGIVSFLSQELARELLGRLSPTNTSLAQRRLALNTLDRLFSTVVFTPLDVTNAAWSAAGLVIPRDEVDRALEKGGYLAAFPWFLTRYGAGICPRDSWPNRLLMDAFLLTSSRATNGIEDMQNLCNESGTGPVRCLVAAEMASQLKLPVAAPLARRGLQLLTPAGFRADCGLVLDGDSGTARSFALMCQVFRNLRPAEIEALGGSLPPVGAALVRQAYQALRAHPAQPPAACLSSLLDACWTTGLQAPIEATLQNLASQTAPASAAK